VWFFTGVDAARCFVQLVMEGERPSLERLARALDELALAYHGTPEGEPSEDDATPQRTDYRARYSKIATRIPALGLYASVSPKENLEEASYGDAVDDLADIVGDLEEVIWRCENLGDEDANWYFRWAFETHWGRHLRDLSLYLHVQRFGGW